tara:strand:+ start:5453 stop:6001 length:549 start_codon:yes stop_codon:yes gene_type:complete
MIKKNTRKRRKINLKNSLQITNLVYYFSITILSLIIIGFIYSFLSNLNQDEKIIYSNSVNLKKLLVINDYEKKTGHRIKIEILNGCGVVGLADTYSNLFRESGFDVIVSKNAQNFNYSKSQIILRYGKMDYAIETAKIMGTPISEIIEDYNQSLDCDVTIIIGKDYNELISFNNAIEVSPPY